MVKPLSGALYIFVMMCIIHCGLCPLPPLPKGQNLVQGTHKSSLEATGTDRLTSTRESTSLPQGGGATVFGNCQCFHCTSGNKFVVQLIV